jgi:putative sugar O-methyltransferase
MSDSDKSNNWTPENINTFNLDPDLASMLRAMFKAPPIHQPSEFWKMYVRKNIQQLQDEGINNFKNTVNQNYFHWIGGNLREQRHALIKNLGIHKFLLVYFNSLLFPQLEYKPKFWKVSQWRKYRLFLEMLYKYAKNQDRLKLLDDLSEPTEGSPIVIKVNGKLISQDICNSVIEINNAGCERSGDKKRHFIELGAGYGRVAYCVMKTFTNVKYTIIDIPPALYIAQWYLSKTLQDKKVFKFREFRDYLQIKDEFEQADIAFLLPQQAELLPDKSSDLFINISSLHEMTKEQIAYWFNQIDRLCSGYFYTKQWIVHENKSDGIIVKREDYPVKPHWKEIYNRQCEVQPRFFEALYKI